MTAPIVTSGDLKIIRDLAKRVREAAESEINQQRIQRFYQLDEGTLEQPLLLTETDGGMNMVMPDYRPKCQEKWAQNQENGLNGILMHYDIIGDDYPIEPVINVGWTLTSSNYGIELKQTKPETDGSLGAYHIDAPITDLERDLEKLKFRTHSVDRDSTLQQQQFLSEIYDGIMPVRIRGSFWWTLGLTWDAITLIGLENLMLYMYEEPEALHQLLAFLRDDRLRTIDWLEKEELLSFNNENDYCGSGSRGYTHRLPQKGWQPGQSVRTKDMWVLLESQETVGVGPDLYEEFVFNYEKTIAERFGSVYYGCCEPVHTRWEVLRNMPNLKRISISPWCSQEFMTEAMGNQYGYSRKPNPSLISTPHFEEEAIRTDLLETITLTKKHLCPTEIVMKDVHTLSGDAGRLTRWVKMARELITQVYG